MEYFRPDCESPARPGTLGECRTICNPTIRRKNVNTPMKINWGVSHNPVDAVGNAFARKQARVFWHTSMVSGMVKCHYDRTTDD